MQRKTTVGRLHYLKLKFRDFMTETSFDLMVGEERALYLLAIVYAMKEGYLPTDKKTLLSILKVSEEHFDRYWPKVRECFEPVKYNRSKITHRLVEQAYKSYGEKVQLSKRNVETSPKKKKETQTPKKETQTSAKEEPASTETAEPPFMAVDSPKDSKTCGAESLFEDQPASKQSKPIKPAKAPVTRFNIKDLEHIFDMYPDTEKKYTGQAKHDWFEACEKYLEDENDLAKLADAVTIYAEEWKNRPLDKSKFVKYPAYFICNKEGSSLWITYAEQAAVMKSAPEPDEVIKRVKVPWRDFEYGITESDKTYRINNWTEDYRKQWVQEQLAEVPQKNHHKWLEVNELQDYVTSSQEESHV